MQFWNEIVNTALLGTEKRQLETAGLPDDLSEAVAVINGQEGGDGEDRFLQMASVLFNYRRSGSLPLHKEDISFPAAAAETLTYCSEAATQVLRDIISDDQTALLVFWLQLCVNANKLVVPELIPALLNKAVTQKSMQAAVIKVCGKRGEWLSQWNPSWNFMPSTTNDEELWQTGTLDQRKNILRQWRRTDPSKARTALIQSWPEENANNRTELLKQLQGTLGPEDNEWLTTLLNEKSQKVKDLTLTLLKELPGSSIVERYWQLLQPAVTLKKEKALLGMLNKTSLRVELPVAADESVFKTGIEKLSSDKKISDDEFILFQLMSFIPPVYWETHLSATPEEIVGYFQKDQPALLPALVKATVQFKDPRWALAFAKNADVFYIDVIPLLPVQQQELYSTKHFEKYPDAIFQYARQQDREWSPELAKMIFTYTAKNIYQFNISFYKENIHRIPASIVMDLEKCSPREAHLQVMWINLCEQILKLISIKEKTKKAFNA